MSVNEEEANRILKLLRDEYCSYGQALALLISWGEKLHQQGKVNGFEEAKQYTMPR